MSPCSGLALMCQHDGEGPSAPQLARLMLPLLIYVAAMGEQCAFSIVMLGAEGLLYQAWLKVIIGALSPRTLLIGMCLG